MHQEFLDLVFLHEMPHAGTAAAPPPSGVCPAPACAVSRPTTPPPLPAQPPERPLSAERAVSTIPRAGGPAGCPANHEVETGADASTGHWVYPSEQMFFAAMQRKGAAARRRDMRPVVAIHNAVNERAWAAIAAWERPFAAAADCAAPRLANFAGDSRRRSPRARLYALLGYAPPFDRHDWVVDRCGTRVDYVIDFYAGRRPGPPAGPAHSADSPAAPAAGPPSFYLDVRPKLNTWEGVKMRSLRLLGYN